jgi:lipoyl(octanoyl) transferase
VQTTKRTAAAVHGPLGLLALGRVAYEPAWALQRAIQAALMARKQPPQGATPTQAAQWATQANRDQPGWLLLAEHDPVYTLGRNGNPANLLLSKDDLATRGIDFYHIERGGDITYHGPGQLTGYPIVDLEQMGTDLHLFMRRLEEVFIRVAAHYGLSAGRIDGQAGVWLGAGGPSARKLCAFGIKCSRWVTLHGFGLNVNTDLRYFEHIIPCGIADKGVTSLAAELGQPVPMAEVQAVVLECFAQVFGWVFDPDLPRLWATGGN